MNKQRYEDNKQEIINDIYDQYLVNDGVDLIIQLMEESYDRGYEEGLKESEKK